MRIRHNGSKWPGEPPDSVEALIEVLQSETLDPTFERYGRFFGPVVPLRGGRQAGEFMAWGNFLTRSHAFDIRGTLSELLPIARAIKANRQRPAYRRAWARLYRPRREP